jgi:hypothetical protein
VAESPRTASCPIAAIPVQVEQYDFDQQPRSQSWNPSTSAKPGIWESWQENDSYFHAKDNSCSPPIACQPICLISVSDGAEEKVVYVGKTSSSFSRFAAGHRAMTLLHAPHFEGLNKKLYRCCIVLLSNRSREIPIEWITPYESGKKMLSLIESILIYHFQPELNTHFKKRTVKTSIGSIHIQNVTGKTDFLEDEFIFPW